MKNRHSIISAYIVLAVILSVSIMAGCSANNGKFDVSGQSTQGVEEKYYLSSTEDIENLVTDNEKLVINYFDAYTWVVFFDDNSNVESMMYIYEFENDDEAQSMTQTRKDELSKNKTMQISEAYSVSRYVVVCLTDTSFTNVSRLILENNFDGLIVY